MDKGIIGGLMGETGTVITKDGGYNFNIRVVDGIIKKEMLLKLFMVKVQKNQQIHLNQK